jgi:hypothetical protein
VLCFVKKDSFVALLALLSPGAVMMLIRDVRFWLRVGKGCDPAL